MNEELRRTLEDAGVIVDHRLDAGTFAVVWRVLYRRVPRALRVCVHPLEDTPLGRLTQQEQDTLRQIVRVPALVNRTGFIEEIPSDHFVTVWQLAETNLLSWWRSARVGERQLLNYLRQVAYSIDLFNEHGFHLRDVKPENILVEGNSAWLCDFGLSKQVGLSTYRGTVVGTPSYMPQEMERFGESHASNDLYCLAASYLRLKTRLTPEQFWEHRERLGLAPTEASVLAQALHRDPNMRPLGAVAWIDRLEQAVGPWEADQNLVSTVVMRKRGISSFFRSALALISGAVPKRRPA